LYFPNFFLSTGRVLPSPPFSLVGPWPKLPPFFGHSIQFRSPLFLAIFPPPLMFLVYFRLFYFFTCPCSSGYYGFSFFSQLVEAVPFLVPAPVPPLDSSIFFLNFSVFFFLLTSPSVLDLLGEKLSLDSLNTVGDSTAHCCFCPMRHFVGFSCSC